METCKPDDCERVEVDCVGIGWRAESELNERRHHN